MKLERLKTFFSTSPSIKLLRSPHAAYVLYFLFRQFKASGAIVLPQSRLLQQLKEFQEHVHAAEPDVLRDRAENYLTVWSTGDSRWLRRFLDAEHTEPVYELTTHTEDVLKFLQEVFARNSNFVGTESRLKRIVNSVSDIVVRGSSDPETRLEFLRAQRERVEREIASLESGGSVETYSPTAIRERFAEILADLTSLQGDFRAVEAAFRAITRDVQERQSAPDDSRGEILRFALEAEDSLKSQDQGVSFDEFVRSVLSPNKQDEFEALARRLEEIEELSEHRDGVGRIRAMMANLSEEAEKVLKTTRRLSATLRRLLDTRARTRRMRLTSVLSEIRVAATRLADQPHDDDWGIDVMTELDLFNATERTFWTPPANFQPLELSDEAPDEDDSMTAFRQLATMQRLDWTTLRGNISKQLHERERVSLAELLAAHPPAGGAIEILGYVQIAHDDGHEVDQSQTEQVLLAGGGNHSFKNGTSALDFMYEVPRVVFLSRRLRTGDTGNGS